MFGRGQQNNQRLSNEAKVHRSVLKMDNSNSLGLPKCLQINTEIFPLTSGHRLKLLRHRTQQSSPLHQNTSNTRRVCLPQLLQGPDLGRAQQSRPKINLISDIQSVAKTTIILDSILQLLKGDSHRAKSQVQHKPRAFTEGVEQFSAQNCTQRTKKPKIVKNKMTKMFFQEAGMDRKLFSQERSRKQSAKVSEKIEQYTFYGNKGSKCTLKLEDEVCLRTKDELNQIRITKLNKET